MKRRHFLKNATFAGAGLLLPAHRFRAEHLIFIVTCGTRKRDYYEDESLSPNTHRLARESFVFEEDHSERVASHDAAFMELIQGRQVNVGENTWYPTILDYIGGGIVVDGIGKIPRAMQE